MVLISLYCGIRRGSLFGLRWSDIDFKTRTITLRGENNKAGRTARLPINSLVIDTLREWKEQNRQSNHKTAGVDA